MPITKSAEKAFRQSEAKRASNNRVKDEMKDAIKEIKVLISSNDTKEAEKIIPTVYKKIDKAAKKGVIKENTAARKKSNVVKSINKIV